MGLDISDLLGQRIFDQFNTCLNVSMVIRELLYAACDT